MLSMLSYLFACLFFKAQLKTFRVTVELRKEWLGSRTGPMPTTMTVFVEHYYKLSTITIIHKDMDSPNQRRHVHLA